ncbi:MAG: universal stress protein, partial [Chloroflexi bacterium]|nr:universal stress protein [Chloroflexota bacterium]
MSRRAALPSRILIPLANPRTAADLVSIGAALLAHGGVLTALSIVEVPEGMSLSEGATRARQARRLLQRVLEFAPDGVDLRTVVRIGRRAAEGIVELAAEDEADLVIFGWGGRTAGRRGDPDEPVFSATIDEVVRDAPCDIAVVKQRGNADVKRILVPVGGGPHAELALRFAAALGARFDAPVDALHVVAPDLDPTLQSQAERALAMFVRQHAGEVPRPLVASGPDVGAEIMRAAADAEIVVMGASVVGATDGSPFGELPETVAQGAG